MFYWNKFLFQIPIREGAEAILASSMEAVDVDLADLRSREDDENVRSDLAELRRREEEENIRSLVQEVISSSQSNTINRNDAMPPADN